MKKTYIVESQYIDSHLKWALIYPTLEILIKKDMNDENISLQNEIAAKMNVTPTIYNVDETDESIELKFWEFVCKKFRNYGDKDEMSLTGAFIKKLSHDDIDYIIFIIMDKFYFQIHEVVKYMFENVECSEENIKNFIFHIILKGKKFYCGVLKTPHICEYILYENSYQNIFTNLY